MLVSSPGWCRDITSRKAPEIEAFSIALQQYNKGEFIQASEGFRKLEHDFPLLGDFAAKLEIEALISENNLEQALKRIEQFHQKYPRSLLAAHVLELEGDLKESQNSWLNARTCWEFALKAMPKEKDTQASITLKIGRASERLGELGVAYSNYLRVWSLYPTSSQAKEVEAALRRVERALPTLRRTGKDWLARGNSFYALRWNDDALNAYDIAIKEITESKKNSVVYKKARTLFRLRRYKAAVDVFSSLGEIEKARFWLARSLARSGKVKAALLIFEELGQNGSKFFRGRSQFLAAILLAGEGQKSIAKEYFTKLSNKNSTFAKDALWRAAWLSFDEKQYEAALAQFERLIRLQKDPIEALAPKYWAAKMKLLLGRTEGIVELENLASEYPLTYYGWRANGSGSGKALPKRQSSLKISSKNNLNSLQIDRARVLLRLGLTKEALDEISKVRLRARNLRDHIGVSALFAEANDFYRSHRTIVDSYANVLGRGVVPDIENMWLLGWPRPYGKNKFIKSDEKAPLALVFAVMREESGYRPSVISPVGALGLMQIMPATGQRLARDAKRVDFKRDDLFDPSTNLKFGRRYLTNLLRTFDDRDSAAIAAYNAGPEVVKRWLRTKPKVKDDLWVERIPYGETRKYVKRVLRSKYTYEAIYRDLSPLL
tara:strand:+ start:873 stop:2855 length:1983 start_codon:yes stop_codon:yes gene_type:complete